MGCYMASVKERDKHGNPIDDAVFASKGENQAQHNSSFQQFINFRSKKELKDAVKGYLEPEDSSARLAQIEQESALLR